MGFAALVFLPGIRTGTDYVCGKTADSGTPPTLGGGATSAGLVTENNHVENTEGQYGQNISNRDQRHRKDENSERYLRNQRVFTRVDEDHRL